MQVLHAKQSTSDTRRLILASIYELRALVRNARDTQLSLPSLAKNPYINSIDMMLLDSAFKDFPLENADKTLLLLPDKFLTMLHKAIWILIETLT